MKITSASMWLNREPDGTLTVCSDSGQTVRLAAGDVDYQQLLNGVWNAYLAGSAENARLIQDVAEYGPKDLTIWTGSPLPLRIQAARNSPLVVRLSSLFSLSPWFGGWRKLTETDLATFRFMTVAETYDQATSQDALRQLLREHPAYPAVSFLDGDVFSKTRLLSLIGDPRWFHDPSHPEREARLRMFLGLTSRNVARFLTEASLPRGQRLPEHPDDKSLIASPNYARLPVLMGSAYPGWVSVPASVGQDLGPRYFFHWPLRKRDQVMSARELATYAIRRLERLVSFVRQVWLHELAPQGREVFVPRLFFAYCERDAEPVARAYLRHRESLPARVGAGTDR